MTATASDSLLLATEVWTPDHEAGTWRLAEAGYGAHESLRPQRPRGRDDGPLAAGIGPGAVLAHDLESERAARAPDAPQLGCVLVLPAWDEGRCIARCLLFIAPGGPAAVELWRGAAGDHELGLGAAWQPGLERFASISRHIRFPLGSGLPGRAWERGTAQLCADLATETGFLRSTTAASEGLERGLALPVIADGILHQVVLLLAGERAPLFRAAEIWLPGTDGRLHPGRSSHPTGSGLGRAAARLRPRPGAGLLGRAWAARRPVLAEGLADEYLERGDLAAAEGCTGALAVPTLVGGDLRSVCLLWW